MSRRPSRREVLERGAAGLVTSGLAGCTGGEEVPEAGRIDHVIVVMMENRSFDHYLGSLRATEGRDEVDGLTGLESNPDLAGDEVVVFPLEAPCQEDPPHGWASCHSQFAEGQNAGFVTEHESRVGTGQGDWVMGYYQREQLPVHYALADAYALPDRYHCALLGPTWPNRLYGHCGTSNGQADNSFPPTGGFAMKTVYKALEEVGEEWRYYYSDLPWMGLFKDHWDTLRVRPLDDFFLDVERGELPAFTWIDPAFGFSDDHPPHHPGLGQMFLATVYEALARSPVWERCLLVITYDEHGGFYDHVPPGTTDDEFAEQGFSQLGFRVPALVVGPWVRPGVDSTVLSHVSPLKYVCERFGVTPWTDRIAAANSLSVLLDQERMASNTPLEPVVLPAFEVPEEEVGPECQYAVMTLSGQVELADWVGTNQPEHIRTFGRSELLKHAARLDLVK